MHLRSSQIYLQTTEMNLKNGAFSPQKGVSRSDLHPKQMQHPLKGGQLQLLPLSVL